MTATTQKFFEDAYTVDTNILIKRILIIIDANGHAIRSIGYIFHEPKVRLTNPFVTRLTFIRKPCRKTIQLKINKIY
jgi:hypothetical protein